jgi:hypothetical protein
VLLDLAVSTQFQGTRLQFPEANALHRRPCAETKELIAGYWIIQVKSREEALEWAKRSRAFESDGGEGQIELRQFFELEDFTPSQAVERHRELGKELNANK